VINALFFAATGRNDGTQQGRTSCSRLQFLAFSLDSIMSIALLSFLRYNRSCFIVICTKPLSKACFMEKKISCIHTPREKQSPAPTSTFLTRICYQDGLQVIRTVHEMVKNARKCMNGLKTKITMPLPNQPKVKWFTPY